MIDLDENLRKIDPNMKNVPIQTYYGMTKPIKIFHFIIDSRQEYYFLFITQLYKLTNCFQYSKTFLNDEKTLFQ